MNVFAMYTFTVYDVVVGVDLGTVTKNMSLVDDPCCTTN